MSFTVILEVAIGLIFVWVVLALITSAILEWLSQAFKWKSQMLEQAIGTLLTGQDVTTDQTAKGAVEEFFGHPLIKGLHSQGGNRRPSQIPSKLFASAVFNLITKAGTETSAAQQVSLSGENSLFDKLQTQIGALRKEQPKEAKIDLTHLAKAMDVLLIDISHNIDKADQSIAEARKRVEDWFDNAMERVGGAYKRKTQIASAIVGIGLAFAFNADSLAIANTLWRDPMIREALVAQAEQFELPAGEQNPTQAIVNNYKDLQGFSIPLGWTPDNTPTGNIFNNYNVWGIKVVGIILSGAAAAQGAPFWFEMMQKLLNLRSGGKGSSGDAAKKDDKEEAKG